MRQFEYVEIFHAVHSRPPHQQAIFPAAQSLSGEVCYQLLLAKDLQYISEDVYRELRTAITGLFKCFPSYRGPLMVN